MRHARVTSVFLLVFSIFVCFEATQLEMGHLHNPGPGFIPLLAGCLLGALSLVIFLQSIIGKEKISAFGGGWLKGSVVVGSLIIYILVLEKLGFLITTFIFLLVSLLSFKPRKLRGALLVSLFTVIISYLVLSLWLKVQLPKGILGI
jgi:hypothetical protein